MRDGIWRSSFTRPGVAVFREHARVSAWAAVGAVVRSGGGERLWPDHGIVFLDELLWVLRRRRLRRGEFTDGVREWRSVLRRVQRRRAVRAGHLRAPEQRDWRRHCDRRRDCDRWRLGDRRRDCNRWRLGDRWRNGNGWRLGDWWRNCDRWRHHDHGWWDRYRWWHRDRRRNCNWWRRRLERRRRDARGLRWDAAALWRRLRGSRSQRGSLRWLRSRLQRRRSLHAGGLSRAPDVVHERRLPRVVRLRSTRSEVQARLLPEPRVPHGRHVRDLDPHLSLRHGNARLRPELRERRQFRELRYPL